MKIDSSFFIEHSEVIGLWFILAIIGLFIFEIICEIVDQKLKQRKIKKFKEVKKKTSYIWGCFKMEKTTKRNRI